MAHQCSLKRESTASAKLYSGRILTNSVPSLSVRIPTGPYVLVGNSAAGLTAWMYAARYPNEIVEIVFVDASSPGQEKGWTLLAPS